MLMWKRDSSFSLPPKKKKEIKEGCQFPILETNMITSLNISHKLKWCFVQKEKKEKKKEMMRTDLFTYRNGRTLVSININIMKYDIRSKSQQNNGLFQFIFSYLSKLTISFAKTQQNYSLKRKRNRTWRRRSIYY